MKWSEMATVRKILTVLEWVSGVLFWPFLALSSCDILEAPAIQCGLLLTHCLCRTFNESNKVMKTIWAILAAICFVLVIMQLLMALNV